MKKIILGMCALPLVVAAPALAASPPPPVTVIGAPGDTAVGHFDDNLRGTSRFNTDSTGNVVQVYGRYRRLNPALSYFTVIYGNGNCDPAQAFPVGPFKVNSSGRGDLAAAVPLPPAVDVGMTGSVSVRRGDDATDIDGDGLTGPGDVVAIAGRPSVGLIECDDDPYVLNLSP